MFKPRKNDVRFFELFSEIIRLTHVAAIKMEDLFRDYTDIDKKLLAIKDMEHDCDKLVHDLNDHLNRSFITPFDRDDVLLIAKVIDNIMDNIESTAYELKLLNIEKIREESFELTGLVTKCVSELTVIFDELPRMKVSQIIQPKIIEINRLENQGDDIYRYNVRNLFTTEMDSVEIIKWKEIYEYMETTLDACEDIANIIEGIVSKNV